MPDTSQATQCPHCGADVGTGHYVCWNCSRDVRMKERTEEEILDEYQGMLAREELRLETRNQRFYLGSTVVAGVLSALGVAMGYWGFLGLFLIFAAVMARFYLRSKRRARRIQGTHGAPAG